MKDLAGARIFITGGTGFIGSALLRTSKELNAEIVVLSRRERHSELKNVTFVTGELKNFQAPGKFSHVIHAAAPTDVDYIKQNPEVAYADIVDGTKRILDFSEKNSARLLFLSSGAVYPPVFGKGPKKMKESDAKITEENHFPSAYARGKVAAERLCLNANTVRARIFALSGAGLPLDKQYALGNFVRDAARGEPIHVNDGSPFRSYLDVSDLANWLWTMLAKGREGDVYNAGSDKPLTILELANLVAKIANTGVQLPTKAAEQVSSYVPDTTKAQTELGLKEWTSLEDSIQAMINAARQS